MSQDELSRTLSAELPFPELVAEQVVLDRYLLKRQIGRGGFGVVWLARDQELRMNVALKFLSTVVSTNVEALADLKRETRNSLRLTHPNIVRIHGFIQGGGLAGLSMEYVDGPTLSALKVAQSARCFAVNELVPLVTQLCDALDHAHQIGRIVHRDLKPGNLMVTARGELKIADFGISRSISETCTRLTMTKSTTGTPAYMSPQQMMGEPSSPLDDVYSLGATLYDLLSSKPPFYTGDIPRQVWKAIPPSIAERREVLEIEANPVPDIWEETIAACLAKDPALRPRSAGKVAELLGCKPATPILVNPDLEPKWSPAEGPPSGSSASGTVVPPPAAAEPFPAAPAVAEVAAPPAKRKRHLEWILFPVAVAALMVTGYLSSPAEPRVEPRQLQFGTVGVGSSVERSFTIANAGRRTLKGEVRAPCDEFVITSGNGRFQLGRNQSMAVTVRFTPTEAGRQGCAVALGDPSLGHVVCAGTGDADTGPGPGFNDNSMPTTPAGGQ